MVTNQIYQGIFLPLGLYGQIIIQWLLRNLLILGSEKLVIVSVNLDNFYWILQRAIREDANHETVSLAGDMGTLRPSEEDFFDTASLYQFQTNTSEVSCMEYDRIIMYDIISYYHHILFCRFALMKERCGNKVPTVRIGSKDFLF